VAQAQDRLQFVFAVVRDRGDMLTKAQARLQDATNALHEWRWEDADGTVPTAKAKAVRHILPEPPGDL